MSTFFYIVAIVIAGVFVLNVGVIVESLIHERFIDCVEDGHTRAAAREEWQHPMR